MVSLEPSSMSSAQAPFSEPAPRSGEGRIVLEHLSGKSRATVLFARSPLRLLSPRNHGTGAWVFVSTLGGGLLGGDSIRLDVSVGAGALSFLGTQSSTKVYRSESPASQILRAQVAEGGVLVSMPDAVCCFAGARYRQEADVHLAKEGSLFLLEGLVSGRVARGERWDFHQYHARTQVFVDGKRTIHEAMVLDPHHGALRERMGRFDVLWTLLLHGPRFQTLRHELRERAKAMVPPPRGPKFPSCDMLVSYNDVGSDGAIVRWLGEPVERTTETLRSWVKGELCNLLRDDPFARKW